MLQIEKVEVIFGDIKVLRGISLEVAQGELTALVGNNNAGKSTSLRAIAGLVNIASGSVLFQGQRIDHLLPHQRAKLGITLVPEGRQLFSQMTVEENIIMGGFLHRQAKKESKERVEWVLDLFPTLKNKLSRKAGTLSGGEQQMVSMGRGLMSAPKLLLIDEPSLGLAPVVVEQVIETIRKLNQEGFSILLVEQNLHLALSVAHRGYVIENGQIVMAESGPSLLQNTQIREKYLGI